MSNKVVCICCSGTAGDKAYAKFAMCEHYLCWNCYFKLDAAERDVFMSYMFLHCPMLDIKDNEPL
jgi:hypothetical protein